ncbi:MAG TPA: DUF4230 domain-containing protein [Gaiellaceae bacterium]|nr:DUF4230 domain-containing protein [Gaiellaceae bacterium]
MTPPEPPQPAAPPPRGRRPFPTGLAWLAAAIVGVLLLVGWLGGLVPDFGNPFAEKTIDRSGPAVLKSVRDLREYRAASGHFQVIVDVERDTRFLPSSLKGERVLFVAVGRVDAGVEFGALEEGAVEVSDDRRSVRIVLPPARFHEPHLDLERSYVYHRDRGAIDRLADAFGDGGDDRELYRNAEQRLAAAARDGSGLLRRAEQNTRAMLEALLRSLGFTRVEIEFADV